MKNLQIITLIILVSLLSYFSYSQSFCTIQDVPLNTSIPQNQTVWNCKQYSLTTCKNGSQVNQSYSVKACNAVVYNTVESVQLVPSLQNTGKWNCIHPMFYNPQCKVYEKAKFTNSQTINALLSIFVPFSCVSSADGYELVRNVVKNYSFWGQITIVLNVSTCIPKQQSSPQSIQCAQWTGQCDCDSNDIYPSTLFRSNIKICTMCKTGFSLASNCTICDSANWFVQSKINSSRCFQGHAGCETYDQADACSKCKPGYAYINGRCDTCDVKNGYRASSSNYSVCISIIPNCQNYSLTDKCTNCTTGFALASDRCDKCDYQKGYIVANSNPSKCMINIPNCQNYDATDSCSTCLTGYLLTNQRCDVCDFFNNYTNSRIDVTKCFLATPKCNSYDNSNNCIACRIGFALINGKCDTCAQGYLPSKMEVGQCFQIVRNCQTYDNTDKCISCTTGWLLRDDYCNTCDVQKGFISSQNDWKKCIYFVPNCQIYQNNTCISCTTQFLLKDGRCDLCDQAKGYRRSSFDSTKCFSKIPNCDRYDSSDKCVICLSGFALINNKCDTCILGKTLISQCALCDTDNGYIASNSINNLTQCIKVIPKCISYTQNNTCQGCEKGFLLANGRCDGCKTNFTLLNGACVCQENYQPSKQYRGKCQPIVPKCMRYENTVCAACKINYRLTNDTPPKCGPGIENCQVFNSTLCIKCIKGYYLLNGTCQVLPAINNCKIYYCELTNIFQGRNSNSRYCHICVEGYHPSNDRTRCIPKIPYCSQYSDETCTSCKQGYYLNATLNTCSIIPVCPANTRSIRYDVVNGKCVAVDLNCNQFDQVKNCMKCCYGFQFVPCKGLVLYKKCQLV